MASGLETAAAPLATAPPATAPTAPSLTGRLTVTAAVRLGGLGCALLTAFALARLLGAAEFGRNALAISWATGLGAVALAGSDQLLLREVSANGEPTRVAALRAFSRRYGMLPTAVAAVLVVIVMLVLREPLMLPAVVGVVVLFGAMRRRQALLLAGGRTGLAQAGESVGVPVLRAAIAIPILVVGVAGDGAVLAVSAYAAAMALVVIGQSQVIGPVQRRPRASDAGAPSRGEWARSTRSFAVVNTLVIVQASIDLWMLGALSTRAQVGSYAVAMRLAALVALPLNIVTFAVARDVAAMHAEGRFPLLQRQVGRLRVLSVVAAVVIAVVVLEASPLVQWLLGRSFDHVSAPLVILVGAQLVNVAIGPVSTLLLMTGHERDVRNTVVVATALNLCLSAALIPKLGAVGAAAGAGASLVWWNVALQRRVRARLSGGGRVRARRHQHRT